MRLVILSIIVRKFPNLLLLMKVIPLYKGKGSKFDSKNYCPLRLLASTSKILEKVITMQLVDHMDKCGLWHPLQHAYGKDRSTVTAMLFLHEEWMNMIDKKEQGILMGIDLSSTFHMVSH